MPLLNDAQRAQLLANGESRARDQSFDPFPVVKVYTPDAGASWLLMSLDAHGDRAFGLCDAGLGNPELGDISLAALETMQGPRGMRAAADPHFKPRHRLSAYLSAARKDGSIND